jgi:hypothetical protein
MLIHNADITGSLTINNVPFNSGSFSGSFRGDGSQLTGIDTDPFPYTGSAIVSGSLNVIGDLLQNGLPIETDPFPYTGSAIISGSLEVTGSISTDTDANINSLTVGKGGGNLETNTAVGYNAFLSNTDGNFNVAMGYNALASSVEGDGNVAIGYNALSSSLAGMGPNTAIGRRALENNTYGFRNTAVGNASLLSNTSGIFNTAVGNNTLVDNTDGSCNVAVGDGALCSNTNGTDGIGIGNFSLSSNTTGNCNIAVGTYSLYNNTVGNCNVAVGNDSLERNVTGSNNIAIGSRAGRYAGASTTSLTSIDNSILLGYQSRALNATGDTNEIVIGYNVVGSGSNTTVIGNNDTVSTTLKGAVSASIFSGSFVGNGSGLTGVVNASTASYVELSNVNGSASLSTRLTDLESFSSSLDTIYATDAQLNAATASLSSSLASSIALKLNISETSSFAKTPVNNSFAGTQQFVNITATGTASFAYLQAVTGSAKIIGDAFIILNNDTPSERYAGIIVVDSGSVNTTASFQFDGQTNDWFYEYNSASIVDHAVALFGPEYSTKGSPTYLTDNKLPKATDRHHLIDSNISDNGTTISLGSNTQVTGSLNVSGGVTGSFTGSFVGNGSGLTGISIPPSVFAYTGSSNTSILPLSGSNSVSTACFATIGGGRSNLASGCISTISGGCLNTANITFATIGGGARNCATGASSTIAGGGGTIVGTGNTASGAYSTISGGRANVSSGGCSTVSGGCTNTASGCQSTVAGGTINIACGPCSTISGGKCNTASGYYTTVSGGYCNKACGTNSFVGAGKNNTSSGYYATVSGGFLNTASSYNSTVGGGWVNTASGRCSTVGGGDSNRACGCRSVISGGYCNTANGTCSGILGGALNHTCGCADAFIVGSNICATAACYTFMNNTCTLGTTRTTTLVETSARKHKDQILPLGNQLSKVNKLSPVEFVWKTNGIKDIGLIAEEVEQIYPELVSREDNGEIHGVHYSKITTVLIKALQEQQTQIEELKLEIQKLKEII